MAEETGKGNQRPGDDPKNKQGLPTKSDDKRPEASEEPPMSGPEDDQRAAATRKGAEGDQQGPAKLADLKYVKTTDNTEQEVTVLAGVDGKTPISPQNPSPRAVSNPDAKYFQTPAPNEP